MAAVAGAKEEGTPPAAAPAGGASSPAERIRRAVAERLARHDEAVRAAEIKPGDPIEPVLASSREQIVWTGQTAEAMTDMVLAQAGRPLSPEAERLLAERVGTMAAAAVKSEAWRFTRRTVTRAVLGAGAGVTALVLAALGGGYWLGARASTVTLQVRPGEIAAVCRGDAVQRAPDGSGRICAVWIRLDQAAILGAAGR